LESCCGSVLPEVAPERWSKSRCPFEGALWLAAADPRVPGVLASARRMINVQTTLGHQLLQIMICEAISQVPPDAQDRDLIFEMTSSEQSR
jgi:hypothetical protein